MFTRSQKGPRLFDDVATRLHLHRIACWLYLANTLYWHKTFLDGMNLDHANYGVVIVAFGAALFHLFNHAMAKGMLATAGSS